MDMLADLKKGDPSKNVPLDAVTAMLRERNEESHAMDRIETAQKVAEAMDADYRTPAMQYWALCEQDAAAFEDFLRSAASAYARIVPPVRHALHPPTDHWVSGGGDAADIAATLGLKSEDLLRD